MCMAPETSQLLSFQRRKITLKWPIVYSHTFFRTTMGELRSEILEAQLKLRNCVSRADFDRVVLLMSPPTTMNTTCHFDEDEVIQPNSCKMVSECPKLSDVYLCKCLLFLHKAIADCDNRFVVPQNLLDHGARRSPSPPRKAGCWCVRSTSQSSYSCTKEIARYGLRPVLTRACGGS